MAASLEHTSENTPMGANLIAGGATFRVWAPNAFKVYVIFDFTAATVTEPTDQGLLLTMNAQGHWMGFFPQLKKGQLYMFYVVGTAGQGLKRDPVARALTAEEDSLQWRCILENAAFPWHDQSFVTPAFSDMVIYQLHVGSYYTPNFPACGTFLDVVSKVPYLSALGVTVVQLLPIHEFNTSSSEGYNGCDFYSPEQLYTVTDAALPDYLPAVNALLSDKQLKHYTQADIRGGPAQLRALVDICHCYGIAVLFDLVYHHAGPDFDANDLSFLDMQGVLPDFAQSLYLTTTGYIGQVFDFSKPEVCDFLIQNAAFFLQEYHVDGFRYDEISNLNAYGEQPYAWQFCQNLTSTLKFLKPGALHHAEYWAGEYWIAKNQIVVPSPQGAGFDTVLSDSQRNAVRDLIGAASQPNDSPLNMLELGQGLWETGFPQEWQLVQGPENHDITYYNTGGAIRITHLSDPSNARSWYATSRSRVAMGICLTGPGIPMLFMGQEFLEDKLWSDEFTMSQYLLYWEGISLQKQMSDFLRFTTDLIHLRWQYPALRGQGFAFTHNNNAGRVLAFHRWIPDVGQDVMVVVSLCNTDTYNYRIGFPAGGTWTEAFNSDVYEDWVNPNVCGNGGQVSTDDEPYDGFNYSVALSIPANGILVFAV